MRLPQPHTSTSPHPHADNPHRRCDGSLHTLRRSPCTLQSIAHSHPRCTRQRHHGSLRTWIQCPAQAPRYCTPWCTAHRTQTTTPRSRLVAQLVQVWVSEWDLALVPMSVHVWVERCMHPRQLHTSESPRLDAGNPHHSHDASLCSPHRIPCIAQCIQDPLHTPRCPYCTHPHLHCQTRTPILYLAEAPRYCTPWCTLHRMRTTTPHSRLVAQLVQVWVSRWAQVWAPLCLGLVWAVSYRPHPQECTSM